MTSRTIIYVVRSVQALFAIVIMALIGHMISTSGWNMLPRKGGNAAEVNYTMFLGVWTLLTVIGFILITLKKKGAKGYQILIASAGLDGLTTLFYMCGAIALAAAMGIHSCPNKFYRENNRITNSSPDTKWRCREAQAATAFVWFNFLVFVVTTTFSIRDLYFHSYPRDPRAAHEDPEALGPPEYSGEPIVADSDMPSGSGKDSTSTISGRTAVAAVLNNDGSVVTQEP